MRAVLHPAFLAARASCPSICPPSLRLAAARLRSLSPASFKAMQVLNATENLAPSSTAAEPPAKQARLVTAAAAAAAAGDAAMAAAEEEMFRVQRISERAVLPARGSAKAAGYDIASAEDAVVPAKGKACLSTGLRIAVPPGTYGRVAPRSGLAAKHFIDVGAGVVDEDYRGELKVLLFNHGDADFKVSAGDRIAQLVLERIATPAVTEVASLDDTERGAGGFGSTGGFGGAAAPAPQQ